jgi:hypothetical protein
MATHQMYGGTRHHEVVPSQAKSAASILAILAAIGSFFVANAAFKFGLAMGAVVLGLVGAAKAMSPRTSGGLLSIAAITIAGIGLLAAILDAVGVF